MTEGFVVVLEAFPPQRREHIERVIHKHNRPLDHHAVAVLATQVGAGGSAVVARYHEEHVASNVVAELAYHGARARLEAAVAPG